MTLPHPYQIIISNIENLNACQLNIYLCQALDFSQCQHLTTTEDLEKACEQAIKFHGQTLVWRGHDTDSQRDLFLEMTDFKVIYRKQTLYLP